MRTLYCALLVLAATSLNAAAQLQVTRTNIPPGFTLQWNASPSPEVAGYNMYYGGSSGVYTNVTQIIGINTTNAVITNGIVRGNTYFFAVTAYATNGLESVYSNEVNARSTPLPVAPVLQQPIPK